MFVAYADTDVFTLGQSIRPEALVFQHASGTWKLATVVNGLSGTSQPRWPVLCRAAAGPAAAAVLPPADNGATLTRMLDQAATGAAETAKTAAPLAVNSFFAGPDSINAPFATDSRRVRAGGVTLAQRFAPAAGPPLALPLAASRGYWLVGVFSQTSVYHSANGTRKASWPDGSSIGSPRPAAGSCWTASSAASHQSCALTPRKPAGMLRDLTIGVAGATPIVRSRSGAGAGAGGAGAGAAECDV